jgi:type IV pilus biogenesis protein CpaD/CtpE
MVGGDHKWVARVAIAVISVAVLAGCSTTPDAGDNTLTLAKTKSPVQFLRNETASRVPTAIIQDVGASEDVSVACKTKEADPDGIVRRWKSSVLMNIETGSSWRTSAVADELIASYEAEGWTAARGPATNVSVTILESDRSTAAIEIQTTLPAEDKTGASLRVTTTGPCVDTDGADSSEVRKLENRTD